MDTKATSVALALATFAALNPANGQSLDPKLPAGVYQFASSEIFDCTGNNIGTGGYLYVPVIGRTGAEIALNIYLTSGYILIGFGPVPVGGLGAWTASAPAAATLDEIQYNPPPIVKPTSVSFVVTRLTEKSASIVITFTNAYCPTTSVQALIYRTSPFVEPFEQSPSGMPYTLLQDRPHLSMRPW